MYAVFAVSRSEIIQSRMLARTLQPGRGLFGLAWSAARSLLAGTIQQIDAR